MIRLLHGDCLAMLKEVEPGSVDLILCDPPYSSGGTHAGDRKASTTAKYTDNDFNGAARLPAFSGDNMDQRSFTAFMRWVRSELRQKTREGGILEMFVDWRNFPAMTDAVQMAGWVWRGVVVWDKGISRTSRDASGTTASSWSGAPMAICLLTGRLLKAPRPCRASTMSP